MTVFRVAEPFFVSHDRFLCRMTVFRVAGPLFVSPEIWSNFRIFRFWTNFRKNFDFGQNLGNFAKISSLVKFDEKFRFRSNFRKISIDVEIKRNITSFFSKISKNFDFGQIFENFDLNKIFENFGLFENFYFSQSSENLKSLVKIWKKFNFRKSPILAKSSKKIRFWSKFSKNFVWNKFFENFRFFLEN